MTGTPGLYLIFMELEEDREIQVGKLGRFAFPAGYYSYTGSAMRGLEARLARHHRKAKRLFWHIDYLLQWARVVDIRSYPLAEGGNGLSGSPSSRPTPRFECQLNQAVLNHPGARVLVPGFGSSDCHCPSHLVYYLGKSPTCASSPGKDFSLRSK